MYPPGPYIARELSERIRSMDPVGEPYCTHCMRWSTSSKQRHLCGDFEHFDGEDKSGDPIEQHKRVMLHHEFRFYYKPHVWRRLIVRMYVCGRKHRSGMCVRAAEHCDARSRRCMYEEITREMQ